MLQADINEIAVQLDRSVTLEDDTSDEEKQALQPLTVYAAAGVAFWRHKNFNYTNPDDNLKDSYLYMKDLADKVRDLPSSYFKLLHDL